MNSIERGPRGIESSGESEPLYTTPRVALPEKFHDRGLKGDAYAQVFESALDDPTFTHETHYEVDVLPKYAADHNADPEAIVPTITQHSSLEEAQKTADAVVADAENWDSDKYN